MRRTNFTFVLGALLAGVVLPFPVDADIIQLKNGNKLEGEVVRENEQTVTIEFQGLGKLDLNRNEIASIEQSTANESALAKQEQTTQVGPQQELERVAAKEAHFIDAAKEPSQLEQLCEGIRSVTPENISLEQLELREGVVIVRGVILGEREEGLRQVAGYVDRLQGVPGIADIMIGSVQRSVRDGEPFTRFTLKISPLNEAHQHLEQGSAYHEEGVAQLPAVAPTPKPARATGDTQSSFISMDLWRTPIGDSVMGFMVVVLVFALFCFLILRKGKTAKRSGGVTLMAILLIIGGAFRVLMVPLQWPLFQSTIEDMDRKMAKIQADAKIMKKSAGSKESLSDDVEVLRTRIRELASDAQATLTSAKFRVSGWLGTLLGCIELVAGIGILRLREWARRLAVWLATLWIPIGLWGLWLQRTLNFQRRMHQVIADFQQKTLLDVYQRLADIKGGVAPNNLHNPTMVFEQARQRADLIYTIGDWLGILMVVGWAVFVIWFFNRRSIRAQFVVKSQA